MRPRRTALVVLVVPESGDSIQTMKAGLMEASDLFVVNKADRPGAERMARELSMMLHLRLGSEACPSRLRDSTAGGAQQVLPEAP